MSKYRMSKYRIHVEVATGDGYVYVLQKRIMGMYFTMEGKYLLLEEVIAYYNDLE